MSWTINNNIVQMPVSNMEKGYKLYKEELIFFSREHDRWIVQQFLYVKNEEDDEVVDVMQNYETTFRRGSHRLMADIMPWFKKTKQYEIAENNQMQRDV